MFPLGKDVVKPHSDDVLLCGCPETAGKIQQRGLEDYSFPVFELFLPGPPTEYIFQENILMEQSLAQKTQMSVF